MDEFQTKYIDFLFRVTRKSEAELRGMPEFKETFSKFDSINLLYREAQAIADGTIVATNTDAPENLLTVARSIQEQLALEAFSKYVIPAMKGEIEGYTSIPVESRREAFSTMVGQFDFLGPAVRKYIGSLGDEELTDFVLENAVDRAKLDEMSFETMKILVNEKWRDYVLDPDSVTVSIDQIWEMGMEIDKILSDLSPELKAEVQTEAKRVFDLLTESRSLTGDAKEAKVAQYDNACVEAADKFAHIPGLEPLFYHYLATLEIEDSYGRAGEEAAEAAEEDPPEEERTESPPEETRSRTQSVRDYYLVDDQTGEISVNGSLSLRERMFNYAKSNEGASWRNVPEIRDKAAADQAKIIEAHMPPSLESLNAELARLKDAKKEAKDGAARVKADKAIKRQKSLIKSTKAKIKALRHKYGDNWQEEYRREITERIVRAQSETLDRRFRTQEAAQVRQQQREALERGENVQISTAPIYMGEAKFVLQNFRRTVNEEGNTVLVDKVTGKEVTSPRTTATFAFAELWVRSFGNAGEAFSNANRYKYEHLQERARKMIIASGNLDPAALAADLKSLGMTKIAQTLLGNEEAIAATTEFYRTQTPSARTMTTGRTV